MYTSRPVTCRLSSVCYSSFSTDIHLRNTQFIQQSAYFKHEFMSSHYLTHRCTIMRAFILIVHIPTWYKSVQPFCQPKKSVYLLLSVGRCVLSGARFTYTLLHYTSPCANKTICNGTNVKNNFYYTH